MALEIPPSESEISDSSSLEIELLDPVPRTANVIGYNVVMVLGFQRSGKSTILNEIFGANFKVVNLPLGSRQIIRGIWMQIVPLSFGLLKSKPIVLFEIQGSLMERGPYPKQTFEYRSALFSSLLADVLIFNWWFTELERCSAQNLGILETVLAVKFKLYRDVERPAPTTLAIFVRDTPEDASIEVSSSVNYIFVKRIEILWNEITNNVILIIALNSIAGTSI
eukprot:GHVP01028682.1.p1 GENE.GHVP01028682.1~~GHVP01028682.1.p1  ORF type:complete len:223 (-),score=38.80 GHVP01028682.1:40-708(-)